MTFWQCRGWRSDASTTFEGGPNPEPWIMKALIQAIGEERSSPCGVSPALEKIHQPIVDVVQKVRLQVFKGQSMMTYPVERLGEVNRNDYNVFIGSVAMTNYRQRHGDQQKSAAAHPQTVGGGAPTNCWRRHAHKLLAATWPADGSSCMLLHCHEQNFMRGLSGTNCIFAYIRRVLYKVLHTPHPGCDLYLGASNLINFLHERAVTCVILTILG